MGLRGRVPRGHHEENSGDAFEGGNQRRRVAQVSGHDLDTAWQVGLVPNEFSIVTTLTTIFTTDRFYL
jgi:hypothetical protein